eukprot:scaffold2522_cov121-Isochrysis_galbana.AAC.1
MRLDHSFKTSSESTQTTHLKPNRERFSEAVPSHFSLSPSYTPTPTFRARSTRTSEKPQMTLAPLEAFETSLSNEPKEVSPPHPHSPKDSQSHKLQDLSGVTVAPPTPHQLYTRRPPASCCYL